MLKDYLDRDIYNLIIKSFSFDDITEIRMRTNQNVIIVIKNKKYFLKDASDNYVKSTKQMIESFIKRASENSLYAFNDEIKNGYLTLPKGVRVGICGELVTDGEKVVTIKNFQSINIRIPHNIINCSLPALDFIFDGELKNTLIISPPGCGKTTFIRDLVWQLYRQNVPLNLLIADERNEICSVISGEQQLDMGGFCDIYTNCSKSFAFKCGIRSMRPDAIICDELDLNKDINSITEAINSGVNVVATIHASNLKQLKSKPNFDHIIDEGYFSRFIVLSAEEGPGTLVGIYDEKLNCLYSRL